MTSEQRCCYCRCERKMKSSQPLNIIVMSGPISKSLNRTLYNTSLSVNLCFRNKFTYDAHRVRVARKTAVSPMSDTIRLEENHVCSTYPCLRLFNTTKTSENTFSNMSESRTQNIFSTFFCFVPRSFKPLWGSLSVANA